MTSGSVHNFHGCMPPNSNVLYSLYAKKTLVNLHFDLLYSSLTKGSLCFSKSNIGYYDFTVRFIITFGPVEIERSCATEFRSKPCDVA